VALCDKPAKVIRNGQWFCGEHDPMRKIQGTMTEIERKAACFDELVAALEAVLPHAANRIDSLNFQDSQSHSSMVSARAALKKAKGEDR
jgi:hypothetical protein